MKPILFQMGSFYLPSYTFLMMVGIFAATFFAVRVAKGRGLNAAYVLDLAMIGIVMGFLGGRIAHVLIEAPDYYLEAPVRFFYFGQGGFVSFGTHLTLLVSWVLYLKWRKVPLWAYMDVAAMAAPLALLFGRTGCLLVGCCYGKPTDFFFSLQFTDPGSTASYYGYRDIPLHATQIYMMAKHLIIWLFFLYLYRRHWKFQGQFISLFFILMGVARFLIEFLRGDRDRGVYDIAITEISAGQIAMLVYLGIGLFLYFRLKKRGLVPPQKGIWMPAG